MYPWLTTPAKDVPCKVCYVDFGPAIIANIGVDATYINQCFDTIARLLSPINIILTNYYPDDVRQGEWICVRILHQLRWRYGAAGTTPQSYYRQCSFYQETIALTAAQVGNPVYTGHIAAHELIHVLGEMPRKKVYHAPETDTHDLMNPYAPVGSTLQPRTIDLVNECIASSFTNKRFSDEVLLYGPTGNPEITIHDPKPPAQLEVPEPVTRYRCGWSPSEFN